MEGRAAALAHLREAAQRFSHHWGLNQLLVEWLSDEPLAQQEQAVRHLLAIGPDAAWAQRELASVLAQQRRFDEAQQALEQARALAPDAPAFHTTSAFIALLRGDRAAVRAACRNALATSVDNDYALQRLLDSCATLEERREELAFVYQQLKSQVTRGDGMYTFQQVARGTYEPEELLAILREALAARPDLWHAWVAVGRQLVAMNRLDEALALCDETVRRFPLLPRVHAERAELMRLRGERSAEQDSLREALRLSPGWAQACCRLADSLEAQSDLAGSRAALESAVRHAPGEGYLHGYLADVLWRQDERALSLEHLTRALRLDPGYEWAWVTLRTRGEECAEPERAIALAHQITASRAADTRAWLGLAAVTADETERLHALERAVLLAPLSVRAHSRRLQALVDAGRFDEALAALSATAWGEGLPTELRAQRARIQAARGDVKTAVTTMQEVLSADPHYLDGWGALADWQLELRDSAGYLAAAEQLHRLAPNDPHALGYLAHASRMHGTNADARPWLQRALQLKPDYAWAAGELFDLELEAGNLDAARSALETLKTHFPGPTTLGREVELHARRRDKHAAMRRYRELLARHRGGARRHPGGGQRTGRGRLALRPAGDARHRRARPGHPPGRRHRVGQCLARGPGQPFHAPARSAGKRHAGPQRRRGLSRGSGEDAQPAAPAPLPAPDAPLAGRGHQHLGHGRLCAAGSGADRPGAPLARRLARPRRRQAVDAPQRGLRPA